jgi:hypothetical protein
LCNTKTPNHNAEAKVTKNVEPMLTNDFVKLSVNFNTADTAMPEKA